jgi:hypothetical protein
VDKKVVLKNKKKRGNEMKVVDERMKEKEKYVRKIEEL